MIRSTLKFNITIWSRTKKRLKPCKEHSIVSLKIDMICNIYKIYFHVKKEGKFLEKVYDIATTK